jgi:hypothetical protein
MQDTIEETTIFRRLHCINGNVKKNTKANLQEINNGCTCKQKAPNAKKNMINKHFSKAKSKEAVLE